jgi:hypothetical protein
LKSEASSVSCAYDANNHRPDECLPGILSEPGVHGKREGGARQYSKSWAQAPTLPVQDLRQNVARQIKRDSKMKDRVERLSEYEQAVRTNRQLATILQTQGLNEVGAHFAYRAQKLQRVLLRLQRKFFSYLFSLILDLLAGYGYRPVRSALWYLVIIFVFAITNFAFGKISPLEAFVLSLTSFHGRGFFPGTNLSLSDPRVVLAAFEAVIGLFIEISFIATFTKRFFGT